MSVFSVFQTLFGGTPVPFARVRPDRRPVINKEKPVIAASATLAINKIFRQLQFIDRSFKLDLWSSPEHQANVQHDVTVMHANADLKFVRLELLSGTAVMAEFRFQFIDDRGQAHVYDTAGGVELPLIDRGKVTGSRLLVQQGGKESTYKHLLKLNWSAADQLRKQTGSEFESEHAKRISGGRQQASFFVGQGQRHRLLVTQTGTRGFAFAKDLDFNEVSVFLLDRFAAPGVALKPGVIVTGVVVQTPKGLQARSIAAA